MIKIVTVCGNGIGSSLLLRLKVEAIAKDLGIEVEVESCDSNAAVGKGADLYVTVKEFKDIFKEADSWNILYDEESHFVSSIAGK